MSSPDVEINQEGFQYGEGNKTFGRKNIKLNLGCGRDIRDGWDNYDLFPLDKRVKKLDLNKLPLPFETNSIDYIYMGSVFEHLDVNRLDFMEESHRILKPDDVIEILVPRNHHRVNHTIGFFNMDYFDAICDTCLKTWRFEKLSCGYLRDASFFAKLFLMFPVVEKLFPLMFNGHIVWKLKKII